LPGVFCREGTVRKGQLGDELEGENVRLEKRTGGGRGNG